MGVVRFELMMKGTKKETKDAESIKENLKAEVLSSFLTKIKSIIRHNPHKYFYGKSKTACMQKLSKLF